MLILFFTQIINCYDTGGRSNILELASFYVVAIMVYKCYARWRIVIGRLLYVTVFAFYRCRRRRMWVQSVLIFIYSSDVQFILLV